MKRRVWELDFLRGFSIIMMVFDHFMYDVKSLPMWFSNFYANAAEGSFVREAYHFAQNYWVGDLRSFFHYIFIGIFLLVSGISFTFSHNNLLRSLKFFIVAMLITIVTYLLSSFGGLDVLIIFGIIHMFALGTLITYLFRKIWNNDFFILIIGSLMIAYGLYFKFWEVSYYNEVTWSNLPSIIIGTKAFGADHFGLFPYTGVIMIGTVVGNLFYARKNSLIPHLEKKWTRPFVFAGKYTLWIFALHQVVLTAFVYLLGYLLGFKI